MKAGNRQTIDLNLLKSNHFYCWKIIINEKTCTSGELVAWSLPQKLTPHQAAGRERELTFFLMLHIGTKLKQPHRTSEETQKGSTFLLFGTLVMRVGFLLIFFFFFKFLSIF